MGKKIASIKTQKVKLIHRDVNSLKYELYFLYLISALIGLGAAVWCLAQSHIIKCVWRQYTEEMWKPAQPHIKLQETNRSILWQWISYSCLFYELPFFYIWFLCASPFTPLLCFYPPPLSLLSHCLSLSSHSFSHSLSLSLIVCLINHLVCRRAVIKSLVQGYRARHSWRV